MAKSIPVTDYNDLDRLFTRRKQNRNQARSKLRLMNGLDTETWKGNIFLIADSDGRYLDEIKAESVIKFLFHKKYQNAWNFFFNLGYDSEVILKLLGKELNQYLKTRKLSFEYDKFKLWYIPNKCLAIKKGHHSVVFYDIMQFYGRISLVKAYQKNIGKPLDPEYLEMKSKRDQLPPRFYRDNKKKVREYCITDCVLTKELAQKWIQLFHKAFGFYPIRWLSSGNLAEKVLINNRIEIPRFDSIPYEIQKLAFRSYFGARFENLKRGFIGKGYLYDINSAYPYALTQIPDLSKGKWIKAKTIHPHAKLGFFRIVANISDARYITPFPFRKKIMLFFPSGKFETYVTLFELLACENPKWYRILDSWQFIPSRKAEYPYTKFIESLFKKRMNLKKRSDPLEMPFKLILNSIYGKTGEEIRDWIIGNLFNPVIFASITGFVRAQLYEFVKKHRIERKVVAFATDSITVTKKLAVSNSQKLGEMKLVTEANDAYFLQNGYYRLNGKWKTRGFGKLKGMEIEHLDTIERNGRLYIRYVESRNTRLKTAIREGRISDIGKIRPEVREINLNADRKRLWLGRIESIDSKTMNDSMPISFNHFEKDVI